VLKKIMGISLAFILWVSLLPATIFADINSPSVFLNGKKLEFAVQPIIIDGSTLVPIRKIFEELGATVMWNDESKTVSAVRGSIVITYKIGNNYYSIGDGIAKKPATNVTMPVAGQIINGSTLVPLRFVGEALGTSVGWEGNSRTITISSAVKKEVIVNRVIEGDTIEVEWEGNLEKIRLIGVDTPGNVDPNKTVQDYVKEVSEYTKAQLTNARIQVELDVSERDKDGILLGYVYKADGTFFNAKLLAEGYAQLATNPPNLRWVELFKYLQSEAKTEKRGLWKDLDQTPTNNVVLADITITNVNKESGVVILKNQSSKDVNMSDWKILSVEGKQSFTFPKGYVLKSQNEVRVASGNVGKVLVAAGENTDGSTGYFLWTTDNIWNNEKVNIAELYNAKGEKVSEFK
jgi:endonuclease YncB( thermonuclease family)